MDGSRPHGHKIDEESLIYDSRYGRMGVCKLCGIKMYRTLIATKPKRNRPHMSKKARKKLRAEVNKTKWDTK